ncbi:hypothetical protein [Sphingobacterium hungaricum]|nr:hypothetical protein [Sphingobacterium hungaricum]
MIASKKITHRFFKSYFLFILLIATLANGNASANTSLFKTESLQALIDVATKNKTTLVLKTNSQYLVSKPLRITCSIEGNGATVTVNSDAVVGVEISSNNLVINSLNISGARLKMIDLKANNVTISRCHFSTKSYFVLLRIGGHNTKLLNSTLENYYKSRFQYAIKSQDKIPINGLVVENCKIYGGVYMENLTKNKYGGYSFRENSFEVNYSHAVQNINNQHDGFRFAGIDGITFLDNIINFKDVNRGFKFTDAEAGLKGRTQSNNPTTNILFSGNKITSVSKNGKQLFDFYDGTAIASISNNIISSKGHTTIFEDKTTMSLPSSRKLIVSKNKIYFDFRICYYRGATKKTQLKNNVSISFIDNDFFYTGNVQASSKIQRSGSNKDFKLEYLIYVRSLNNFEFVSNRLNTDSPANSFSNSRVIFINDVSKSNVENNKISGGISFQKEGVNDDLRFVNNTIDEISLPTVIDLKSSQKNIKLDNHISFEGNQVKMKSKNIKIINSSSESTMMKANKISY